MHILLKHLIESHDQTKASIKELFASSNTYLQLEEKLHHLRQNTQCKNPKESSGIWTLENYIDLRSILGLKSIHPIDHLKKFPLKR